MIIDILVLLVLLASALIAFIRGFIRETLTIAGVGGGLAAAFFGAPFLSPYVRGWFGVEEGVEPERLFSILPYDLVADALSYGGIFIVVVIVLSMASHVLAEAARNIGLGAIDRTLGFIFGLVRGVVLLAILYLPLYLFVDKEVKAEWFKDSRSHFYLEQSSDVLAGILPDQTIDNLSEEVKRVEEVSATQKQMELLKEQMQEGGTLPEVPKALQEGYTEDFRNQMDSLFENKQEDYNP